MLPVLLNEVTSAGKYSSSCSLRPREINLWLVNLTRDAINNFTDRFSLHSSDGDLVTSVTPICSNDSAAVEVVARSNDDIRSEDRRHRALSVRIDYICIGDDGEQVSENLQRWGWT